MEHDALDYEDRNGLVGMSMTFDYEGYYQIVGANNGQYHQILEEVSGFRPVAATQSVDGHVRMTPPVDTPPPTTIVGSSLVDSLDGLDESLIFPISPIIETGIPEGPRVFPTLPTDPVPTLPIMVLPVSTPESEEIAARTIARI